MEEKEECKPTEHNFVHPDITYKGLTRHYTMIFCTKCGKSKFISPSEEVKDGR